MLKENYDNKMNSNGAVAFFGIKSNNIKKFTKTQNKIYSIVLSRAKKIYDVQIDKSSCSLYRDCILLVLKNTKGITEVEFKAHYLESVLDMLDRVSFNNECKNREWNAYMIATHLAVMPLSQRKKILADMDKFPVEALLCNSPIFKLEELQNLDKYQLLPDGIDAIAE